MVSRNAWARVLTGILAAGALTACASADPAGRTSPAAPAADSARAGLVVLHADGSSRTACVAFAGTSLRGDDLLRRSGLGANLDSGNPMGSLVCSIDQEGCDFPAEPCLCACDSPGACSYWAYFHHDRQAGWMYSALGAQMREVHAGELDAWVWLLSSGPTDSEAVMERLRPFDFEDVCPAR